MINKLKLKIFSIICFDKTFNGEEKITFTMNYNPANTEAGISRIDGIGTLWNVTSNKDTEVFSNLVKE